MTGSRHFVLHGFKGLMAASSKAGRVVLGCAALALVAAAVVGCGGDTKTITETVEVESRTTVEGAGTGAADPVTEYCSSPQGEEIDALSAEANQALVHHQKARLVDSVEAMIAIAENSPPGARCIYAPLDSAKILLGEYPELIRRISEVEQSRELTEADVERVEREANG